MQRRIFAFDGRSPFTFPFFTLMAAVATASGATPAWAGDSEERVATSRYDNPHIPQAINAPGGTTRQPGVFGMNLEAQAVLPLGLGAAVTFEGPFGFRAGLGVGATPSAFISLGMEATRQPGTYSNAQATTVLDALEDPLYMRISFALCPPDWSGFYFGVGYGFLRAAASLKAGNVPRDMWPSIAGLNENTYAGLAVVSHHVTADIGWEFALTDRWRLRATVGGIFTFAADSTLSVNNLTKVTSEAEQQRQITEAEDQISAAVVQYGSIPSVTLALSYRIF